MEEGITEKGIKNIIVSLFIIGLITLIAFLADWGKVDPQGSVKLKGFVLTEKPLFNSNDKGPGYVELHFHEYDRSFEIHDFDYRCMQVHDLIEDLEASDTVSIWMRMEDTALLREQTLVDDYNRVLQVEHNETIYGDINCSDLSRDKSYIFWMGIGLLGSLVLFMLSRIKYM